MWYDSFSKQSSCNRAIFGTLFLFSSLKVAYLRPAPSLSSPLLFAHVGKAGGGTVGKIIEDLGSSGLFTVCHPLPCLKAASNVTHVLVTVRDPVERFVSAFNWRTALLCERNDTRAHRHGHAYLGPGKNCDSGRDQERVILHEKYHFRASELAEAMCEVGTKVASDIKHIRHLSSLTDHLGGAGALPVLLEKGVRFYATVLDPSVNSFEVEAESTIVQLLEDAGAGILPVLTRGVAAPQSTVETSGSEHLHPAVANVRNEASGLSTAASQCVGEYYSADYATIEALHEVACHGPSAGSCQTALRAILERRPQRELL